MELQPQQHLVKLRFLKADVQGARKTSAESNPKVLGLESGQVL